MGCRLSYLWVANVFALVTLAAQPADDAERQNTARVKAALEGLKKATMHQKMPDDLRRPAHYYLEWLGPRLLSKDKNWKGEPGQKEKASEPLPVVYVESLELDLKMLQAALSNSNGKLGKETALNVVQDLETKVADCVKFGRGRLVPLEVFTVRGGQVVNNWQVYYKYAAVGDLPTAKMPMECLTSPARKSLPPGQYDIQAESTVGGSFVQSAVVRCAVGGTPVARLEIQILH